MSEMKTVVTLFEYQSYRFESAERDYFHNETFYITQKTMGALEDLNRSKPFMECGLRTIRPLNYVGVVRAGNVTIQIFPKLFKDERYQDHRKTIAANLLKMLSYSGDIPFREMDIAGLDLHKHDLFEVFIHLFARNLLSTMKSSQKKEYIKKSEEIRIIKGRIDFKKYVNPCRFHIIPCEYYEFSVDNIMNRTLKYTCHLMARAVEDFDTARTLRSIINILDQVTLTRITAAEADTITFDRLNRVFEPYIEMCKIFLSQSTLTLQSSEIESFSLLIPMEKLFEGFITEVLKEDPHYFFGRPVSVRSQMSVGRMAFDENGKELFNLIPDILIGSPVIEAIIDTKYKALDTTDTKLGVSQADIYQMYVYATKTNTDQCMLLYPEVMVNQKKDLTLSVPSSDDGNRDVLLMIRSIRLSYNMINKEEWEEFRRELRTIVKPLLRERQGWDDLKTSMALADGQGD